MTQPLACTYLVNEFSPYKVDFQESEQCGACDRRSQADSRTSVLSGPQTWHWPKERNITYCTVNFSDFLVPNSFFQSYQKKDNCTSESIYYSQVSVHLISLHSCCNSNFITTLGSSFVAIMYKDTKNQS